MTSNEMSIIKTYCDCDIQRMLFEEEVEDDVDIFFTRISAQSTWQASGLSSIMISVACQLGNAADKVFALCRNEDYYVGYATMEYMTQP
jgi:hypothetical protein